MEQWEIELHKEELRERLFTWSGLDRSDPPLTRENFCNKLFTGIDRVVRYNRQNMLVRSAVLGQFDLTPRIFTILSILYGSFNYTPNALNMLLEFIDMLDKNLDEQEEETCMYARARKQGFFLELYLAWENILRIYADKETYDRKPLPPSPHLAYTLLVLNREEVVLRRGTEREIFAEICELNRYVENCHSIIKSSQRKP